MIIEDENNNTLHFVYVATDDVQFAKYYNLKS